MVAFDYSVGADCLRLTYENRFLVVRNFLPVWGQFLRHFQQVYFINLRLRAIAE